MKTKTQCDIELELPTLITRRLKNLSFMNQNMLKKVL